MTQRQRIGLFLLILSGLLFVTFYVGSVNHRPAPEWYEGIMNLIGFVGGTVMLIMNDKEGKNE